MSRNSLWRKHWHWLPCGERSQYSKAFIPQGDPERAMPGVVPAATKEAVFDEMIEALVVQAKLPTGDLAWQDWVRRFAAAMRALAHEHPGACEAFHYAPAQGEQAAETFEAAFAAFRAGGFDTVSAYNAIKATSLAVLGLMLDDTARERGGARRDDVSRLSAERFPHTHEAARVAEEADTFSYMIDVLIAGLAASLRSGRSA